MKRSFTTGQREPEVIEECLFADDFERLPVADKPGLKAAILSGYRLDRFRRDYDHNTRHSPELARELWACRSIIITRPHMRLDVYGSERVTPFDNLWARLKRGDRSALPALELTALQPAA